MKTSIRIERLKIGKGARTLSAAELHGKRQDETSQARKINDEPPLVLDGQSGLDLERLYTEHVGDAKADKRTKWPVQHWLFQWPIDLNPTLEMQTRMLDISMNFANELLGGRGVFAARLDRDEGNQHVVDVFCTPLVEKHNKKSGEKADWIQTSKHLKALCYKHEDEIRRRYPTIKDITSPRCQGIALQSEWTNHLRELGYPIEDRNPKRHGQPDRVSPEAVKARHELNAREEALINRETALAQREAVVGGLQEDLFDYAIEHGVEFPPYDKTLNPDLPSDDETPSL